MTISQVTYHNLEKKSLQIPPDQNIISNRFFSQSFLINIPINCFVVKKAKICRVVTQIYGRQSNKNLGMENQMISRI